VATEPVKLKRPATGRHIIRRCRSHRFSARAGSKTSRPGASWRSRCTIVVQNAALKATAEAIVLCLREVVRYLLGADPAGLREGDASPEGRWLQT